MPGFSLDEEMPVLGRTVVVHSSSGSRVGCGIITPSTAEVVLVGGYPGVDGGTSVNGLLTVEEAGSSIRIGGILTGLGAGATAGWHIHTGYSCDSSDGVFGHYYTSGSDPWLSTTYTSDSSGVAPIETTMSGFSLHTQDVQPVFGRTVVVHGSDGSRTGCGVIGGAFGVSSALVTATRYPTYSEGFFSGAALVGSLVETSGQLTLHAVLTGVEPNAVAGWHIHSGFSCDSHDEVGGHYYDGLDVDPWTTTYSSDSSGTSIIEATIASFSLERDRPVAGRTLVVHLSGGARVLCGIIAPSSAPVSVIGSYPGYTPGQSVRGLISVSPVSTGIRLAGLLSGLEVSTTAGVHIHSGYTCDDANGVFGHYPDMDGSDPWTTTYTSDGEGVASVDLTLPKFSLYGSAPVYGRAIVVHTSSARAGCGLIGDAAFEYPATSLLGTYPGFDDSSYHVKGMLKLWSLPGTSQLRIQGVLAGLEPSSVGGWHIHSGFSCDDSDLVGGHFFDGLIQDPWTTRYSANADGVALVDLTMPDFTLQPRIARGVGGRTVVVHLPDGSRAACGTIFPFGIGHSEVVHISSYPGVGDTDVRGMMLQKEMQMGLHLSGIITGLGSSSTGGFHVHSGYSW